MNWPRLLFRLTLGRRMPITSGTLAVPGIVGQLTIRRDRYGIPYIEAQNNDDAWYGLGFCQGQDRAFQLQGLRRIVRGTLAELIGTDGLPLDRLSRRIGFRHSAEQQITALDDDICRVLDAFGRGVTDGSNLGCRRKAHEFFLLRAKPMPYDAADILGVLKIMSFTLASNWDVELARLNILTEDGAEALKDLDPIDPERLPVSTPPVTMAGLAFDRLAEDLSLFAAAVGRGGGSNNWAIAPSRTATGRAILANDPHLDAALPPYWYLAHIQTPDWTVAGASFVGAPSIPVGHNGTAAWGVTAGLIDNTDLFVEEVGPDGKSVREGDRLVPCETRREVIQVKGSSSVEEDVLVTPRGPIVGPALDGEVGALSLSATWLASRPVRGLLDVHRARNFQEFRRAFEQWPLMPLNMVYADTSGAVGWQMVGEAPQRRKGWGTIPLPGWDPEVGWMDAPVPFDEMPHEFRPNTGFVATANNQPTQAGGGAFLGVDWLDGYRHARIVEALEGRHDWSIAAVLALQMDQLSIPWRELRDSVLSAPAETDEARLGLTLLKDWDCVMATGSPGATVFEFFVAEMIRRVVEAKAPRSARWSTGTGFTQLTPHSGFAMRRVGHLVRLLREQPEGWFRHSWPAFLAP